MVDCVCVTNAIFNSCKVGDLARMREMIPAGLSALGARKLQEMPDNVQYCWTKNTATEMPLNYG